MFAPWEIDFKAPAVSITELPQEGIAVICTVLLPSAGNIIASELQFWIFLCESGHVNNHTT